MTAVANPIPDKKERERERLKAQYAKLKASMTAEEFREKNRKAIRRFRTLNPEATKAHASKYRSTPNGRVMRSISASRYQKKNADRLRPKIAAARLLNQYGLTPDQRDRMLAAQKHKCPICAHDLTQTCRKGIDHDHRTGAVRGILHGLCNTMLGHAKDSIATLERAIAYLEEHNIGGMF